MIIDKAQELGRLIGQSEEYKALKRARDALEQAGDLKPQLDRLEALARLIGEAAARDEDPPAAEAGEYDRLFGEIQSDSRYQGLVAAQSNFDKLMLRVQEQIMEGMRKGAESSIITLG